jgi:cytochrome c5
MGILATKFFQGVSCSLSSRQLIEVAVKKLAVLWAISSVFMFGAVEVNATSKDAYSKQATIDRITPVGKVCIEGKTCEGVQTSASAPAAGGAGRSSEQVFNSVCAGCHSTGAMGAPKVGDKGAWSSRIGKGKATLYTHAIAGFNAMPAKGTCMSCSDAEIKAAVDYMVSKSK